MRNQYLYVFLFCGTHYSFVCCKILSSIVSLGLFFFLFEDYIGSLADVALCSQSGNRKKKYTSGRVWRNKLEVAEATNKLQSSATARRGAASSSDAALVRAVTLATHGPSGIAGGGPPAPHPLSSGLCLLGPSQLWTPRRNPEAHHPRELLFTLRKVDNIWIFKPNRWPN